MVILKVPFEGIAAYRVFNGNPKKNFRILILGSNKGRSENRLFRRYGKKSVFLVSRVFKAVYGLGRHGKNISLCFLTCFENFFVLYFSALLPFSVVSSYF